MKTIERAHTPKKMWERIKLSRNYEQALARIDKELIYWPKYIVHKVCRSFDKPKCLPASDLIVIPGSEQTKVYKDYTIFNQNEKTKI